jgi:signal transduction histidine kinase
VNTVYVDHEGTIWAGTNSGLNKFDQSNQKFTTYYERDGLASSVVKGILQDRLGDLWLSTSDGLSRFNPRTKAFKNYYSTDGLPGNEFVQGAASRSSTGEMFFGSSKGLLTFFAEGVVDDSSPPPVVLTDFWLFGDRSRAGKDLLKQSISFVRSLTLAPRQNIFSIEFSALSYSDPARNRYRYRLAGLEKQWNERDSTRRLVTYTTLAPGDYVFRVQGSNSLGVWNETGATVRIRVLGFWWTWWWVRTAFIAILITLVWGLHRLRLHQIAYEFNIRLEARVNERTRIARELHDTLLQSFQGVLLKLSSLKYVIPDRPTEAVESLEHLVEQARAAVTEGRDAVQGLRSSTVVANDLARAIATFGNGLVGDQPGENRPELSVQVEGKSRDLPPLVRDEIYHIACESLRNAFRHAQAKRIEVEFRYDPRRFRLRVVDNGKGIDPTVLSAGGRVGHHGLPGINERAELAGGKLSVWSQIDSGTEIEVTIPASVAYLKSPPGRRSKSAGEELNSR